VPNYWIKMPIFMSLLNYLLYIDMYTHLVKRYKNRLHIVFITNYIIPVKLLKKYYERMSDILCKCVMEKVAEKRDYYNRGEKWINQSLPFDRTKSIEAILVDQ
jgi:hypothetical protein